MAAEKEVADQHAGLVAPENAGGLLAAAHVAFVDDIVMQQSGRVHELDGGGELDVMFALVAEHAGRGERQHRAQALAAGGDEMVGDLGNQLDMGTGLGKNQLVHAFHIGLGQVDQRLDRGLFVFVFVKRYDYAQGSGSYRIWAGQ